ncbi:hypothetical protein [uncultured Pseudomonas sp.]|uniref:hypothetical protein n=1 Tax=uncultured Pseudomonas sp. TaxID=114707 RepID=UPI0025CB8706|nr:hypothetical protein [uncultured Pseudomonas sp.]
MTTQQVVAFLIICLFVTGLFAYAYFLGKRAGRRAQPTGLLFGSPPCAGSCGSTTVSPQISISEGSGHAAQQAIRDIRPASLRHGRSINAQETNSLCCEAAGIIQHISSPSEALTPHDKLREAAPVDATLIAGNRPPAQPAQGYTPSPVIRSIVATVDAALAVQAGVYSTAEQLAEAIVNNLQGSGLLPPAEPAPQDLRDRLDELMIKREEEQRKHHHLVANFKRIIDELEQRIMSYTGMAVTRADYDLLIETTKTLELTERTLNALKANQQAQKANEQIQQLTQFAMRLHAHLRATPATAGAAA